MATYYVRTDGNNSNVGTGSTSGQAWQTVTYALANMVLTTGTNYLYIAPGVYRETPTVTVTPSSTQTLVIQGDTTASLFSGVSPNLVRITNFINDNTYPTAGIVFNCAKTYVTIRNVFFAMYGYANFTNAQYITIDKCTFESTQWNNSTTVRLVANGTTPINGIITNSIFIGSYSLNICGPTGGASFDFAVSISNCLFFGQRTILVDSSTSQFSTTGGNGLTVYNSTFMCDQGIGLFTTNTTNLTDIKNCNFIGTGGGSSYGIVASSTWYTEDFNRFSTTIGKNAGALSANSKSGTTGIDWSSSLITAGISLPILAPTESSPLTGTGTSTGAPATDIYGNAWVSGTDIGAFARQTIAGAGFYVPTERNASAITIAPGSTSQSVELFLGATGLTASTAGLSARYNRTRTASVAISLVARTIAQAWTSGGFAEVDSTNMPGVYRLDLPDAALAAGASDVTIVVRGASGTNGAVLTVTLSSGGLTAAQTAAAVLDAVGSSYVTAGSIGYSIQNSNVASISSSTAAADELEGALLHNGTDYISAELVTPVTSAALVRMGPFEVRADGLGASDPLDIQKGAQHGVDIQCVDNNGAGIDITSATVTAKVYNSGATLVDTYACTATYAADGRATFTIDTTVTNTTGTYTATITRSTTANDTQVFGPLRIYVRDI
jgi:hypothetical protein